MISFKVPGAPRPKGSLTHVAPGVMLEGKTADARDRIAAYRWGVAAVARTAMARTKTPPHKGPVALEIEFVVKRPKTVKDRYPHKRPDIDKLARAVCDSLKGICYVDDGQIVDLWLSKRYTTGEPYTSIGIKESP